MVRQESRRQYTQLKLRNLTKPTSALLDQGPPEWWAQGREGGMFPRLPLLEGLGQRMIRHFTSRLGDGRSP